MRRFLVALLLFAGCSGQFPTTRVGARALFCAREACPHEAEDFGAYVVEQSADVDGCACVLTDGENTFKVEVPYARW